MMTALSEKDGFLLENQTEQEEDEEEEDSSCSKSTFNKVEKTRKRSTNPSTMVMVNCCRGFNPRLLFLMGSAMIEYISHVVMLILCPLLALKYFPDTSLGRIGFYTALLSGSGYLGHFLSCRVWINVARTLKSSKGVILWGLAVIGGGHLALMLCQSFLAMVLVRFGIGLFSGVTPVALIEIDEICGNRQTTLASTAKYLGTSIGAAVVFTIFAFGKHLFKTPPSEDSSLYFYCFTFVSVVSWLAVIVILLGLRLQTRGTYIQLAADEVTGKDALREELELTTAIDATPSAASVASKAAAIAVGGPMNKEQAMEVVKCAIKETKKTLQDITKISNSTNTILFGPRPHFRTIRSMIPHFFHGYDKMGHLVIWDLIGQAKIEKLHHAGFTTMDLKEHYLFFLQFAVDKLLSMTNKSGKFVYVIDLDGLDRAEVDEKTIQSAVVVIKEVQKTFPDRLHRMVVLNAPAWFVEIMKEIRKEITAETIEKVSFAQKDAIEEHLSQIIGKDALLSRFGGKNAVKIGESNEEKALDEWLAKTTGSMEKTKEIIRSKTGAIRETVRLMKEAAKQDTAITIEEVGESSDEEDAFFDCAEYGLQEEAIEEMENKTTSSPKHSSLFEEKETANEKKVESNWDLEAAAPLSALSPTAGLKQKKKSIEKKKSKANTSPTSTSEAQVDNSSEGLSTISREGPACLVLSVYFMWVIVQIGFDEIFPLWYLNRDLKEATSLHDMQKIKRLDVAAGKKSHLPDAMDSIMLHVSGSIALVSIVACVCQMLFCSFSMNGFLTPLAKLRLGMLLQFPLIGAFPLIDVFHLHRFSFAPWIVMGILFLKQMTSLIALNGLVMLLDNSIAMDRRLLVHRASHVVKYAALFLGSVVCPILFSIVMYFGKPFPLDQSTLYFTLGGILLALCLFSFVLPTHLNSPQLFAWRKR